MKRLLYLTALSMVVTLILAPAVVAQQDVDCPQLSQGQAQAILDADPSDPNRLDADDDGLACEDGGGSPPRAIPGGAQDDADCPDFVSAAGNPSQFQAQQFFDANDPAQDPFNLDADDDGIACEELETGAAEDETTTEDDNAVTVQYDQYNTEATAATAQYDQYAGAEAVPVAPATVLPDTSGLSLPLVAGALLLSTGVLGLSLLKRTS